MASEGRLTERDLDGLRAVLNAWDPIGVYQLDVQAAGGGSAWPADEYDCLRWPLVARLERGASRREVAAFLGEELRDHFGLSASVTEDTLDRVFSWWESVR